MTVTSIHSIPDELLVQIFNLSGDPSTLLNLRLVSWHFKTISEDLQTWKKLPGNNLLNFHTFTLTCANKRKTHLFALTLLKAHVGKAWDRIPIYPTENREPKIDELKLTQLHRLYHANTGCYGLALKTEELAFIIFVSKTSLRYDISTGNTGSFGTLFQEGKWQNLRFTPYLEIKQILYEEALLPRQERSQNRETSP